MERWVGALTQSALVGAHTQWCMERWVGGRWRLAKFVDSVTFQKVFAALVIANGILIGVTFRPLAPPSTTLAPPSTTTIHHHP